MVEKQERHRMLVAEQPEQEVKDKPRMLLYAELKPEQLEDLEKLENLVDNALNQEEFGEEERRAISLKEAFDRTINKVGMKEGRQPGGR